MRYGAIRISLIYVIVSLLWITFSDQLLFVFEHKLQVSQYLWLSTAKGYFFVIITGIFLFYLIRSDDKILQRSEQQYRSIYDSNPNPMWIYEPDSLKFISVNDAAIESYGYGRDEFLNKTILDIRPEEDKLKIFTALTRIGDKLNQSGTWRHVKKNGEIIFVSITSHQIKFNDQTHVLVMARDMTETIKFEHTLEQMNRDLLEEKRKLSETQLFTKVAGWEFYPKEGRLIWSDEVYRLMGLDKDDKREAFDIYIQHIFPEDRPMMISALQALVTEGKQLDVTHRIIALDGTTRYIRQLARVDTDDRPANKVIGSLQDITEFKQLETERNKYLYNFENTLNSISDAFFALDRDMKITHINEPFRELVAKGDQPIVGESIFKLFPENVNKFYTTYQKALEERVIVKREDYSVVLGKWIRLSAYPTDEGVSVYFSDITENKLKDARLKEAVERYELVAQATKDVVYDLDMVHDKLIYNTSLTQLVHIPIDMIEYNLKWWRSLIHPDDMVEVVKSQQKISNEGLTNWECEYRINCGDNNYKYVMDQGYFVYNEQKQPIRLIGAIRDIDALKRSMQENKRLADMIKRVNNVIIVTDTRRRVQWVNNAFEELTGFSLDEISGKTPADILIGPDTDKEVLRHVVERELRQETFATDILLYNKALSPFWVSAQLTPAYNDEHVFQGYVIVCQNITFRKEKEEQIKQQNELLREVAWMSSHEIRRPVATMLGLVNLLNHSENDTEREEILPLLEQCANEMDKMVHEIHKKIPTEKLS